jgi:ABC-2 type transport system ATP-binding protein
MVVTVRGLRKSFGDRVVLDGIDFDVPEGTTFALLGPNGAGKTTAVRILSTLIGFDGGEVRIGGHDLAADPGAVRRMIGVTGQFSAVDDLLTGVENLTLMADLGHLDRATRRERVAGLLDGFDLVEAGGRAAATYSGGMRRRLDLGVALVVEPQVLFLDEPTTGLDPRSRLALWDVVRAQRDRGVAVLLTTQYLEEADVLADRVLVLDAGRVIASGSSAELKQRVGGAVCEVVPAEPGDADRYAAALGPMGATMADLQSGVLRIPAPDGPATLAEVVRRLDAAGLVPVDIALHRPSLDDVFLALTGHEAGQAEPSASP